MHQLTSHGSAKTHGASSSQYRSDIDGLRALAVLPILFNHVGLRGFGGGYIGVDIFFVISGYLITGIIRRDLADHRHSILQFYRRRALRILPALTFMLLAVTMLVPILSLPQETLRYAHSLAATSVFATNMLYYSESGYFDTASHAKPLLHLWSLAIEEQFYIFWPLLLTLLRRQTQTVLAVVLFGIIIVSLGISTWLVRTEMTAAFYLLPSRAWELALGGIVSCLPPIRLSRFLAEGLAGISLLVLCYGFWHYSSLTPFPGVAALLPCLATATLITTGPSTWVGRGLSLSAVRFCGLISYSLYLWHWPVIVFAQTGLLLAPTSATIGGEIILSLSLATLSWHFIERPFRNHSRHWSTSRVLSASAAVLVLMLAAAAGLQASGGFQTRFTPRQLAIAAYVGHDFQATYRRGSCFLTDAYDRLAPACITANGKQPSVLIVGDSQAAHLWPGLARYQDRYDILQATVVGCRPGIYPASRHGQCETFYRRILQDWVPAHKPALLILAGRWQKTDPATLDPELAMLEHEGVRTLLVGPVPDYAIELPRLLVAADQRSDPALPSRWLSKEPFDMDMILRRMAAKHGVSYVSPIARLCRHTSCRTEAAPNVPLQFDFHHFTPAGSAVMADFIAPEIATALIARPN